MANLFGHDETTVHQWTLNADQYRAEVRKAAAEIRQIQRDTKDLNLVKAELKRHIAATSPRTSSAREEHEDLRVRRSTVR
jgi:hypothetical protein